MDRVRDTRRTLLIGFLLAAVTLAIYWPARHYAFLNWDDTDYVAENDHVRGGLTWAGVVWSFTKSYSCNWHPLTWLSHMLDCQLYGLQAGAHHFTNVLWHTANTVLLFLVLRSLTGAVWRSAMVAALFALHPLHVESVAWLSERKDVLSAFFFMLTLWAYAGYVASGGWRVARGGELTAENTARQSRNRGWRMEDGGWKPLGAKGLENSSQPASNLDYCSAKNAEMRGREGDSKPQIAQISQKRGLHLCHLCNLWLNSPGLCYFVALLFFACGLMSKPMLVTLPFVLLLLDFWPLGRTQSSKLKVESSKLEVRPSSPSELQPLAFSLQPLLLEKWPFFALSAISCVITFLAQRTGGAVASLQRVPLTARLENVALAYVQYLLKFFWPAHLSPIYPYPDPNQIEPVIGAIILLLVLTAAAWHFRRRFPFCLVGWLWFLGTLVPVIGIVQVGAQSYADRYTYIPLIGIMIAVVWLLAGENHEIHEIHEKKDQRQLAGAPGPVPSAGFRVFGVFRGLPLCILALAILAALAWRTTQQLPVWRNTETLFRPVLAYAPENLQALRSLGGHLITAGQPEAGKPLLQEAARVASSDPALLVDILAPLADVLTDEGQFAEAIQTYQSVLKIKPDHAKVLNNLALLLATCTNTAFRNGPEAVRLSTRVCELTDYKKPLTLATLAAAQAQAGDLKSAIATVEREAALATALGLDEEAKTNHLAANGFRLQLGVTLQSQGKAIEALPYLEEAAVSPELQPERNYRLALSLLEAGRVPEAETALKQALDARPRDPEFQLGMAALLQRQGQNTKAEQLFQSVVGSHPDLLQARRLFADFLMFLNRPADAEAQFAAAVNLQPQDIKLRRGYAGALATQGRINQAIQQLEEALKVEPANAQANFDLAELLSQQGKSQQAIVHYNQALEADPKFLSALNNLAWLLATDPDEHIRSGARAVELGERACQLTEWKAPVLMGTLAAAYAEAGRFPEAVATAEKARDKARADKQEEVAKRNEELLQLYKAGKAYREQPQK